MKCSRFIALFLTLTGVCSFVAAARAGVVVEEQETINRGNAPMTRTRTIIIQGNKQKIITDRDIMITDLDKDVMILINPQSKSYAESPFPPRYLAGMADSVKRVEFAKTGASRTIDGYKCEDYTATSNVMGTESKIVECFAKKAPGAQDFAGFQKQMNAKLQAAGEGAMARDIPVGVPMVSETTTNMAGLKIPGMSPDQAEKFSKMMASRPPIVSKSVVTKITVKKIAESEFAPPAGYTRRELRSRTSAPPASGSAPSDGQSGRPPTHSLPE
jgi:hypothetical protein